MNTPFRIKNSDFVAPLPTNFQMPLQSEPNRIFYAGNYIIEPFDNYVTINKRLVIPSKLPKTPFDEDVIVQFFNDNLALSSNMNIAADQINDLFWNTIWGQAKDVFYAHKGKEPKRITMIMIDNQYTYVNHVNLTHRKNNTNKYEKVLVSDWGFNIKFSLTLTGNKNIISNPDAIATSEMYPYSGLNDPDYGINKSFQFEPGKLIDFDKV